MGNSNDSSLLPSLKKQSEAIKELGGKEKLEYLLNETASLHQTCEDILKECETMLTDEERSDKELRIKFGEKWSRPSSAKLNAPLKVNISKNRTIIGFSYAADCLARSKYEKQKDKIAIMCLPEDAIAEYLKKRKSKGDVQENVLSDLASAYDEYTDLMKFLKGRSEIYKLIIEELASTQNKVNDFCFARKQEREELIKHFQRNVVSSATQPSIFQSPNNENQCQTEVKQAHTEHIESSYSAVRNINENQQFVHQPVKVEPKTSTKISEESLPHSKSDLLMKSKNRSLDTEANPKEFVPEIESVSKHFKELPTDENSENIRIQVGDREFKIKKAILNTRPSVFSAMVQDEESVNQSGVFRILDCDPDTFKVFLDYLHIGELENVPADVVLQLYTISDKYKVHDLTASCVKNLIQNITVENICAVAGLADKYDEINLFSAVEIFFSQNFKNIIKTDEWENLLKSNSQLVNKLLIAKSKYE